MGRVLTLELDPAITVETPGFLRNTFFTQFCVAVNWFVI